MYVQYVLQYRRSDYTTGSMEVRPHLSVPARGGLERGEY